MCWIVCSLCVTVQMRPEENGAVMGGIYSYKRITMEVSGHYWNESVGFIFVVGRFLWFWFEFA